jgi:hypothetical protein
MEFLIILQDSHYKKGFYGLGKSEYDKIVKSNFPGELLILHKDHLRERKDIKIDGTIIMKKVYIKLHKENIYVDASKYQEKLIESTISEFMRIIFSLNPQHISLKMSNDNNDSLTESRHDRLKFLAFIKNNIDKFGQGLLRDYRFFICKKNLPILLNSSKKTKQANILKKYVSSYRTYRWLRLDHHWHLINKLKVRLYSNWFKLFSNII